MRRFISYPRDPPESQTGRELMTAPKELVNTTGFINHSFALKKIDPVFFKTARKFIHIFILQKKHTSVWIAINRCMVLN